ncbi:hypothetical protein SAVIM40S_01971 [Streptomyces avidinii]
MRQETPSTTRWWTTSARRPCCPAPRSRSTARSMRPSRGESSRRAARIRSRVRAGSSPSVLPRASMWSSRSAAATEPAGGTTGSAPAAAIPSGSRSRSISWVSRRAWTVRSASAAPKPGGVRSTSDWLYVSTGPPSSASQPMMGVGVSGPSRRGGTAGPALSRTRPWARAVAASASTLSARSTSRVVTTRPAARARLTTWIAWMLSPPSPVKLWSASTSPRPRTSAKRLRRIRTGSAAAGCSVRWAGSPRGVFPARAATREAGRMSVHTRSTWSRQAWRPSGPCTTLQPAGTGLAAGHSECWSSSLRTTT